MKKFIDTGQSRHVRNISGVVGGGITIGKHGKGHLGSVSPTRTVAGSTSALLTASRPVASGLALEMLGLSC